MRRLLVLVLLLAAARPVHAATADTRCTFGGPAGTWHVARLDLPRGSDFLDLRITAAPPLTVAGDQADSHLTQGVGLLDARTGRLVAARVAYWGSTARAAVVRTDGRTVTDQQLTTPTAPFQHTSGAPVPYLSAGSYYAVAFGTDGDARLPNHPWGAELRVSGRASCLPVGSAQVFDFDNADFSGGDQVTAYGAGVMSGERLTFRTSRRFVFGLLDAHTQLAGSARLAFRGPAGAGEVRDDIVAFTSRRGSLSLTADARGAFPVMEVAGVAFTP
jgi:hypothetical protein